MKKPSSHLRGRSAHMPSLSSAADRRGRGGAHPHRHTGRHSRIVHMAGGNETDTARISLATVYIDATAVCRPAPVGPEPTYQDEVVGIEPGQPLDSALSEDGPARVTTPTGLNAVSVTPRRAALDSRSPLSRSRQADS